MTLLEQCRYWIQNNEPQNAVTAIEALPQEELNEALLLLLEQARSALAGADGNVSSSLLGADEIATLESFDDGNSGYFYSLLDYLTDFIRTGIAEGRFTEEEARADLQIALWYAFGCLNTDEYVFYYRAAEWMPSSEPKAKGCGAWYYRFSVALMYCGRLQEAYDRAEQGVREEPDYPWIWLQAAKLRSYFGNREGALEAVQTGLRLVPDDHEFLTLHEEILAGASLEEMEYHWIDPEADRKLQQGLDMDADSKLRAISCITTNQEGLAAFCELFSVGPEDWLGTAPYCRIRCSALEFPVELVFRMNQAGLSKLGIDWLRTQKERLESGRWTYRNTEDGALAVLDTVLVDLDYSVSLIYRHTDKNLYFQILLNSDGVPEDEAVPQPDEEKPHAADSSTGYLLLSEASWEKTKLIRSLWDEWGIDAREEGETQPDSLLFYVDSMIVTVSLTAAPFSDRELELQAADNDVWTEALDAAAMHQAYLTATVFGHDAEPLERALLHTKVMACCCRQEAAVAVSSNEILFEPQSYVRLADMIRRDQLPVFNWIWFGISCRGNGVCGFTRGMHFFGKDELEILDSRADLCEVQDTLCAAASTILSEDICPLDGDELDLPDTGRFTVTRSEGVFAKGISLKLPFVPQEGNPANPNQDAVPELYTQEELQVLQEHIERCFGPVESVFHEIVSPDIHVDICLIPPSEEHDYFTLVTMGMGAHRMNVPEAFLDYGIRRAELVLALPPDWRLFEKEEQWYWPIRLLKNLARMPGETDSWLGWGHTVDNGEPFAESTQLCAALLISPQGIEDESDVCPLPCGEGVSFYQVIPLYQGEMAFKLSHGADALLEKMKNVSFVTDPERSSVVEDWQEMVIDDADSYLTSIREKQLPLDEACAYTHMAYYLRWCVEHDLVSEEFLRRQQDIVNRLRQTPEAVDLRAFLREELSGMLLLPLFSEDGQAFTLYYYDWEEPSYLSDLRQYALSALSSELPAAEDARREAYLFLPCREETYRAVAALIEARWNDWAELGDAPEL